MLRKLKLNFKNMDHSESVVEYASEKLEPLQNLLKREDGVRWNLRLTKEGHKHKGDEYHAEAQLKTGRKNYGADARGESPYAAIDKLKDELTAKITSHKEKRITRARRGALRIKQLLRGE